MAKRFIVVQLDVVSKNHSMRALVQEIASNLESVMEPMGIRSGRVVEIRDKDDGAMVEDLTRTGAFKVRFF